MALTYPEKELLSARLRAQDAEKLLRKQRDAHKRALARRDALVARLQAENARLEKATAPGERERELSAQLDRTLADLAKAKQRRRDAWAEPKRLEARIVEQKKELDATKADLAETRRNLDLASQDLTRAKALISRQNLDLQGLTKALEKQNNRVALLEQKASARATREAEVRKTLDKAAKA